MVTWANAFARDLAARGSRGVVSVPATLASTTILLLTPGSMLPLPIRNRVM
jgi:hypothetical protein